LAPIGDFGVLPGTAPETVMPRYFFHLHECNDIIEDPEGRVPPDVEEALFEARNDARDLLAAEVRNGKICLGCHIEAVEQDTGATYVMPFKPLLEITGV
jgi:hypothetical protein